MPRRLLRLAVPLLLSLVVLAGCAGDDDDAGETPTMDATAGETATEPGDGSPTPAEPTATATPEGASETPTEPGECPLDDASACELAAAIEEALAAADGAALTGLLAPEQVTCTGEGTSDGGGADPIGTFCEGWEAGTVLEGYSIGARRSDAVGYVAPEEFQTIVTVMTSAALTDAMDDAGTGAVQLMTVAEMDAEWCRDCFAFSYSWIQRRETSTGGGVPARILLELGAQATDQGWTLRFYWTGGVIGDYHLLRGDEDHHRWSPDGDLPPLPELPILYGEAYAVAGTDGECLNIRAEPGTEAEIVTCLEEGAFLVVNGGPQEAGGRTWWMVEHNGPAGQFTGWVAEEFLGALG